MMERVYELVAEVRSQYPEDVFFDEFELSCQNSLAKVSTYQAYNRAFMSLDDKSWNILKRKSLEHYLDHREGQKKQGFFNQLNEAFAFHYLVSKGFHDVHFVEEANVSTPDISYSRLGKQSYCEVKTLCISDDEIDRRNSKQSYKGSVYVGLTDGFLNKFCDSIQRARQQIGMPGFNGLVYLIILFDDIALDYYQDYKKQLNSFVVTRGFDNIFIRIGVLGNKWIFIDKRA